KSCGHSNCLLLSRSLLTCVYSLRITLGHCGVLSLPVTLSRRRAMATEILNEAERFLLKHWAESRLLEESMEGVRTKYKELFQRVIEAVTEAHPELDAYAVYVTQMWSKGSLGFGRKAWPAENQDWPPGFWIDHVRLEKLAADDTSPPMATIWIPTKTAKKTGIELSDARTSLVAAAQG